MTRVKWQPKELLYSMAARCRCGAGLAYPMGEDAMKLRSWFCSRVLLGDVEIDSGRERDASNLDLSRALLEPSGAEHDAYPFWCYEIKSEGQPSAEGRTTRPPEQGIVHWQPRHLCKKCGTKWDGKLCLPPENHKNERTEKCPGCGEGLHTPEGYSNLTIDSRYENVLVPPQGTTA